MTWYYILKFTCSFSETCFLLCNGTLRTCSAIAAPSHRNEWSPVEKKIFIALTAYQMPEVLGRFCLNECWGTRGGRAGFYQALLRSGPSLQGQATLTDSSNDWGSMELNGVPGRAGAPWKQNRYSAEPDTAHQAMHCNSCQKWHKSSSNSASDLCCPSLSPCL